MELKNRHRPGRVTEAREAAGLTKTQLAAKLGCSLSLISEIESGRKDVTPTRLKSLAEALDVEVSYLASPEYLAELNGEEDAA